MRQEKYGTRDLTYSKWHRTLDDELTYIDLDCIEYCADCKHPLVLIELARDVGQSYKATTVMRNLASKAGLPAYLVFYRVSNGDLGPIDLFRVKQVSPTFDQEQRKMTPDEYSQFLRSFRGQHQCRKPIAVATVEGAIETRSMRRN